MITFLEGIFSFLSPCMLPLLPVYLSFFAGNAERGRGKLLRTLLFVAGFTLTFLALGLAASTVGRLLVRYQRLMNLLCGGAMIIFGLSILDVLHLPVPGGGARMGKSGAWSAFVFGLLYPVNLMPCAGAFLGAALAMAASSADQVRGVLLLLVYALGLGIPFVLSALVISQLDRVFQAVRRNYALVRWISGGLLLVAGVLTALGLMNRWLALAG